MGRSDLAFDDVVRCVRDYAVLSVSSFSVEEEMILQGMTLVSGSDRNMASDWPL